MSIYSRRAFNLDGNHAPHWPFALVDGPLTQGLVHCLPMFGGAPLGVNLGSGDPATVFGTLALVPTIHNSLSPDFPSSAGNYINASHAATISNLTAVAWVVNDSLSSFDRIINGLPTQRFSLLTDNNDNLVTQIDNTGHLNALGISLSIGITSLVGMTFDGTDVEGWKDGLIGSSNWQPGAPPSASTSIDVGRVPGGQAWDGRIWSVLVYNRRLAGAEMYALWDPSSRWSIFEQPGRVTYFVPAPAAGFVPYPNPRYAMTGGMQPMSGGVN